VQSQSCSVAVDLPIRDVFDFLAEGRNNPTWRSDVSLVARISGSGAPLGVGASYLQQVTDSQGRTVEETYEITVYEPPHLVEFTSTRGQARILGRYTLVAITSRTTHVEFTLRRLSPEFRMKERRETRSQLHDRVHAIGSLPVAMKDQGAPLLPPVT
jgi:hypothetical protein